VPLLAGLGLSEDTRSKEWPSSVVITFLVLAATAHLVGFAQVLRRFTAGRNGGWFFAHASAWQPPVLGATPLAVLYAAAIFALVAWMCLLGLAPEHEPRTSVDGDDILSATAPRRPRPLSVER
jgi:hypothetical protein